jgi:hypothetical protein
VTGRYPGEEDQMPKDKLGGLGGNVQFPAKGTDPTRCETRSQSHLVHTKHGTVKVVESVPVKKDKS